MRKKTKVLLLSGTIVLCAALLFALLLGLNNWTILLVPKGSAVVTLEYGETYQDAGARATVHGNLFLQKERPLEVMTDSSQVDASQLGSYTVTYTASYLGAKAKAMRTVRVQDTTKPEITLKSTEGYYTRPGDSYQEEGYTATDNCDGDLTDQVVREERDGVVFYTVSDSSGNTATARRYIHYEDREAPQIQLQGETTLTAEKGEPFEEPGYTATDDCDGDITSRVTVTQEGDTVRYEVADSHGNTATAERKLTLVDTQPPELILKGDTEMRINACEDFTDPGYTATDKGDGDLTDAVEVSGTVDDTEPGTYPITYTVTDSQGNTATATRTVTVEKRQSSTGKVVYLTFDDGPGPYTQQLLDVLDKYGAKATFFVTGMDADHAYLIGKEVEAGHSVGIHTYSHKYNQIYASQDAYFSDLAAMDDVIYQQAGIHTHLIRFPGGSSNTVSNFNPGIMTALAKAVQDKGYQYFDWNVASGDAGETTDTNTVAKNVIAGMQTYDTCVVLQHDVKSFSVDAVEQILKYGTSHGYSFLALDESSPGMHHSIAN